MATTQRERLRASEARLRALLEAITDYAIFLLDAEGRVITWSPAAERIKGYRESEIVGRHFSIFYPEEEVAGGKPQRELVVATTEGRFAEEGWRVRKDGSRFMADVVITPVRDEDGALLGFAKVTRDVTDKHREIERSKQEQSSDDRQRIAARLHSTVISLLFDVGIEVQGVAIRSRDSDTTDRLEAAVAKLDDAIRQLRSFIFHPESGAPPGKGDRGGR